MCHPEVPPGTPLPDVATEQVEIAIGNERMPGLLALPPSAPAPGVLVVNDVFGSGPFYEHLTRRLAQAGFVALDVEFFFREGTVPAGDREAAMTRRARYSEQRGLRDLGAVIDWLRAHERVRGARVGTIGFCMGGTLALDLAAERDDLATVSYYGFPAGSPRSETTAPSPIEVAERMHGPILGHWGDQDSGVGMDNVRALDDRLNAAGITHDFHIYNGVGHGFLRAALDDETNPAYAHACTSWTRTIEFLQRELQ